MSKKLLPLHEKQLLDEEKKLAYRYAGKLLLRTEIPLADEQLAVLLERQAFMTITSIKQNKFTNVCKRCNNDKQFLFAVLPCKRCLDDHVYCRSCITMGRVLACEPLYYWSGEQPVWAKHDKPCRWEGELTTSQQAASERIVTTINEQEKELLVWGVCGSGKTEMLFPGITAALQQGKRICIATPRADVVRELLPRFQTAFPLVSIQGLFGGSKDKNGSAQFIIATTHQLLRYQDAFDVLIIDEIDAFPFHADPSLPFAANRAKTAGGSMIYLTATPRNKQRIDVQRKQLPHVFVPIRFHGHPLPIPRFKICYSLTKSLTDLIPPASFLKEVKKRENPNRQLLIFVPTIYLAENMTGILADHFVQEGIISTKELVQAVHAEDPAREEKIQLFRDKKLAVLVTTTILERGVTFPCIDVYVLDAGHIVFDEAALVQIAGRAGRSPADPTGDVVFYHEGKTEAMVRAVRSIKAMNRRGGFK